MSNKKISIITVVLLLFAFFLSACSGIKSSSGNHSDESADSLQRVLKARKLTVVGSGGYPPFNYIDDDGNVIGFDVDVGEEIAKRLGVELDYVTGEWSGLVEGLRSARYDAILGSMAITKERQESVNFTVPYYYSGAQLVVLSDSGITDTSSMKKKTIAVTTGTNYEEDAKALGAKVKLYDDDNSTMLDLLNGRVDGVITDRLVALEAKNKMEQGDKLMLAGSIIRLEEMGIAINKDDTTLLEKINEILKEMHEDGTLSKISEKWQNGADITVK